MKQQFVITHTIRQTEIPALFVIKLFSTAGLQTHLLSKCCVHKTTASPYIFVKTQHA